MGVLTGFKLIEPELAKFKAGEIEGGPVEWLTFQSGKPEDFGLPTDYTPRRISIDKSWDEWSDVLRALDSHEVRDTLFDFPAAVENPWDIHMRYLPVSVFEDPSPGYEDDVAYIKTWLADFDVDAAVETCAKLDLTDYYGGPMDVEYVVSHIGHFAQWLNEHHRPDDRLLISTS